jgi:hypothetical protein
MHTANTIAALGTQPTVALAFPMLGGNGDTIMAASGEPSTAGEGAGGSKERCIPNQR